MKERKIEHNYLVKNVYSYEDPSQGVFLHVKDGKIVDLYRKLPSSKNWEKEIEAQGAILLPGMIDAHTHMRDPGLTQKEDLFTGSKAASHGGVTTFFDMPNTNPPTLTLKALQEKREIAQSKAFVNYGFHFGASSLDNSQEIAKVANIASLKIFLNETTGNLFIREPKVLEALFKAAPSLICLHAEGTNLIQMAFDLAKKYHKNLYFCHISMAEELDLLKRLKREIKENGYPFRIYTEATVHHLAFCQDDLIGENAFLLLMKPPLRTKKDKQALFESLKKGEIDTIGTDHAPHLFTEKKEKITYGVPSIECALPFLLDLVSKDHISLQDVVRLYSQAPSSIFSVQGKGFLKKGFDADFTLVSVKDQTLLNKGNIVSKCGWSLFENKPLNGKVLSTWVKGICVYDARGENYYTDNKLGEVHFE